MRWIDSIYNLLFPLKRNMVIACDAFEALEKAKSITSLTIPKGSPYILKVRPVCPNVFEWMVDFRDVAVTSLQEQDMRWGR